MLKVEGYTEEDAPKIVDFIRKVQPSAKPDRKIISSSVLIKDDQDIVGMVSYKSHGDLGVIRYFLYDARIAGTDIVVGMFFELYQKAHKSGVKQLIAQAPNRDVGMLFEMLGFTKLTKDLPVFADAVRKDVEVMRIDLEGRA